MSEDGIIYVQIFKVMFYINGKEFGKEEKKKKEHVSLNINNYMRPTKVHWGVHDYHYQYL